MFICRPSRPKVPLSQSPIVQKKDNENILVVSMLWLSVEGRGFEGDVVAIGRNEGYARLLACDVADDIH